MYCKSQGRFVFGLLHQMRYAFALNSIKHISFKHPRNVGSDVDLPPRCQCTPQSARIVEQTNGFKVFWLEVKEKPEKTQGFKAFLVCVGIPSASAGGSTPEDCGELLIRM